MDKLSLGKLLVCFVGLFLIISALSTLAVADGSEASVEIEVKYFSNFNPIGAPESADMSDKIYVGSADNFVGSGKVTIPLTENSEGIVDTGLKEDADEVPGLFVLRGEDVDGKYFVLVTSAQNNMNEGDFSGYRENIKFDIKLGNSIIKSFDNSNPDGFGKYENPETDDCGINEGTPSESNPDNDEYNLEVGENQAKFCSVSHRGRDIVKVYYENFNDMPLVISGISTTPSLPLTNDGDSQRIKVSFESNKFPIEVTFDLRDNNNIIVDTFGPINLDSQNSLPVSYYLPESLRKGEYSLVMTVTDDYLNVVSNDLGKIRVEASGNGNDDDDDNDNDNNDNYNGGRYRVVESSQPVSEEYNQGPIYLQEEVVQLNPVKKNINILSLWLVALVALVIVLIILIVLTYTLR